MIDLLIEALVGIDSLITFPLFGIGLTLSSPFTINRILEEVPQKTTKYNLLISFVFFVLSIFCMPIKMFFFNNGVTLCVLLSAIAFIILFIVGVFYFVKGYKYQLNHYKQNVIPEVEEE